MLVPINITGPSYPHRSGSLSSQRTVGFYPELIDTQSKKSQYVLNGWPGLKSFGSVQGGKDRGMFEYKGVVYKITGETLYTIDKDGNHLDIGVISGSKRCIIEGIGDDIVIVSGGNAWVHDSNPDITGYSYSNKSFPSVDTNTTGQFIGKNGTKLYYVGQNVDAVYENNLATAWDLNTASYSGQNHDISTEDTSAGSLYFSDDGENMYMLGRSSLNIYQYTLNPAWDVSTASASPTSVAANTEESDPRGMTFGDEGKKLYIVGYTNDTVYQYTLTIAWDITTASYASKSMLVSGETTSPEELDFNSDGTKLYVMSASDDVVYQYNLTTAWDVSTGSYASLSLDVSTLGGNAVSVFVGNNDNSLYILDGTPVDSIYQYNSIVQITDTDLETPDSCAHLNNQIIFDGDGGRFVSSDVGDATTINGLNYATAEVNADDLVRVYVFDQILYLMGTRTIESWYNSGVGSPPFDRLEGGIIQVGLSAIYSVANNDKYMYFLGDDNQVYRVSGTQEQNISTNALAHEFEAYVIDDAIGFTLTFDNQHFYMLVFPSEDRTWCFSEESGQWFEPNEQRYLGNSQVYAFRKNLIADWSNGNVYELDMDTFDENGNLVERWRTTGPLHGGLFNAPGKRVWMNKFELIMETGVGRLPGSNNQEDPYIMLSVADEDGPFGTERWGKVGKMGNFYKVEWHDLGSFYTRNIKIKVSDPNFWSIHSAAAEIEVGI